MHERLRELAQLDTPPPVAEDYTGPLNHHPVFMRAKAIQDVLAEYITGARDLHEQMNVVVASLINMAQNADLIGEEVTVIGDSDTLLIPCVQVDHATGKAFIQDKGECSDDDEHEMFEDDISTQNSTRLVRSFTGPFAGFDFQQHIVEHIETDDDIDEDTRSKAVLVVSVTGEDIQTPMLAGTMYASGVVGDVGIEFSEDQKKEKTNQIKSTQSLMLTKIIVLFRKK